MTSTVRTTIPATVSATTFAFPVAAFAATRTAPWTIATGKKTKGDSVSIEYADPPKDGFLVIHPSKTHITFSPNLELSTLAY